MMEVLAAISLFSFLGAMCFGVIILLLEAIGVIFENQLLEDVCGIVTKICLLALAIGLTVAITSCVLLIIFGCMRFQLLEVSE